VQTNGDASPVSIVNSADIDATGLTFSNGILGSSAGINSPVSIVNSGDIVSTTTSPVAIFAFGIEAFTSLAGSPVTIDDSGALTVSGAGARGIDVRDLNTDNPIAITNSAAMTVTATAGDAFGIYAANQNSFSGPIAIKNSGDMAVVAGDDAFGIYAGSFGPSSPITIGNKGAITATGADTATGIFARSFGEDSPVSVESSGNMTINAVSNAFGIYVGSYGDNDPVSIDNSGNLAVSGGLAAFGIKAATSVSTTTISREPSTSGADRSAATPPILEAGCSSTPLPTCICSTSTPTRPWASPARSMPPRWG
jgi:autotransporter family porin